MKQTQGFAGAPISGAAVGAFLCSQVQDELFSDLLRESIGHRTDSCLPLKIVKMPRKVAILTFLSNIQTL
jgi:hypothetical protein